MAEGDVRFPSLRHSPMDFARHQVVAKWRWALGHRRILRVPNDCGVAILLLLHRYAPAVPYSTFACRKFGSGQVETVHPAAGVLVANAGKMETFTTFVVETNAPAFLTKCNSETPYGALDFARNRWSLASCERGLHMVEFQRRSERLPTALETPPVQPEVPLWCMENLCFLAFALRILSGGDASSLRRRRVTREKL